MLSDPRQSKKVSYDFFEVLFQVVVSAGQSHESSHF